MNYRSVSGHSPKSHLILIEIDIQKERKRLEKQRRKRLAAQETKKRTTDDDVKSQTHADMIPASSNLGTMATDMAMRQILPNAKQLPTDIPGKGESGQFDRVYIDGDQIYVVESKGGSSDLGSRKDLINQQSQQGRRSILLLRLRIWTKRSRMENSIPDTGLILTSQSRFET